MSDKSISIVPRQSVFPDREIKAKEILDWLISLDIVQPTFTDCVLGSTAGYPISKGAKSISLDPELLPFGLWTNGLDIITERRIFDAGQNGIDELICPSCGQNIAEDDWSFFNEWAGGLSNNLTCSSCLEPREIHEYIFNAQWGFSDLGFVFWNWPPFNETFLNDFKRKLGCDIDVIIAKI